MTRRFAVCFWVVIFLGIVRFVNAQDFPAIHYTTDDGLPSNTIYNIYRDSKNYLWIATNKGIARYNGIRFEIFTTDNGLPDNEIFFFQEDPYGRLWLATYNGKLCYYKDGVFHTAENTGFLRTNAKVGFIRRIIVEGDSSVTFIFWNSSRYLNIDGEHPRYIDLTIELSQLVANGIFNEKKIDKNRYKIYCTDRSLIIDSSSNLINIEKQIHPTHVGTLWGGAYSQGENYFVDQYFVIHFTPEKDFLIPIDSVFAEKNRIACFYESGSDHFYCTNKGLFVNSDLHLLDDIAVQTITQDIHNNYWVGSAEQGVFVINNDFRHTRVFNNTYSGKVVFTYHDQTRLLFVTDAHMLYSLEKGKVTVLLSLDKLVHGAAYWSRRLVFALGDNYRGYYWGNSYALVINSIFGQQPTILSYKNNIPGRFSVDGLIADSGWLYVKTNARIFGVDLRRYKAGDSLVYMILSDSNNDERVFGMAIAPDKSVWYSQSEKLCRIENGTRIEQKQFGEIDLKLFDFFGDYLVGYTHNNRLLICRNYKQTRPVVDTVRPQSCIWDKFYRIDSTHILVQTNGLYRLLTLPLPGDTSWKIWALENRFLPLQAEAIRSFGDKCFFFKNGSVIAVDLNKLVGVSAPPIITFLLLRTNKGSREIEREMELPYSEARNLSISFSTLSRGGKDVSYQYCVSRDERDNWIDLKSERIDLVNSGYGTYKIKVRAKSTSSEYSEPFFFTLHVLRPYWATWWFVTLCVCLSLAVIGVAIRLRILFLVRKNKKEHDTEIKFMRSEYKAINALMNPHFIFNTLNNVQSLFNANDKLAANEYLRIFADLIRQNMHNVSQEMIPLQKEMVLVMNYLMLEKLRFEDKLNYNITVDESIDLSDILIPPLLIQPLVENSIKHGILPLKGSHGIIEINVFERNGILYVEVRDNGLGMSSSAETKSELHESFGMSGIKKRIEQLSIIQNKEIAFNTGEVKDENGKHLWTVVTISMPIS